MIGLYSSGVSTSLKWLNRNLDGIKIFIFLKRNKMSKKTMLVRFYLFITGFTQVFFVSLNTYFLAKEIYMGVFISAFIISLIWSFNVKKVAFGHNLDRIIYALGATFGAVFGLWSSSYIAYTLNNL
jgi:hypothetical protein